MSPPMISSAPLAPVESPSGSPSHDWKPTELIDDVDPLVDGSGLADATADDGPTELEAALRAVAQEAGYRVAPGRDAEQFTALGFKAGDIVTAVNGYTLSDPTNTVRLYQLMRDATDATFEVERDGSPVSISVSLSSLQ